MPGKESRINWKMAIKAIDRAERKLQSQESELNYIGYLHGVHQSGTIHVPGYDRDDWLAVKSRGWLAGTDGQPIITESGLAELAKYVFTEGTHHAHG